MTNNTILKLIPQGDGFDAVCSIHPSYPNAQNHFINRVRFQKNNEVMVELDAGMNISDQPLIGIHISELENGDQVQVIWFSTSGEMGETAVVYQI